MGIICLHLGVLLRSVVLGSIASFQKYSLHNSA